jgi:hypothetical protein
MIVASSHVLSLSPEGGSQWVYSVGLERWCCLLVLDSVTSAPQCIRQPRPRVLFLFSARTNKRHHHRKIFLLQENAFLKGCEEMERINLGPSIGGKRWLKKNGNRRNKTSTEILNKLLTLTFSNSLSVPPSLSPSLSLPLPPSPSLSKLDQHYW